MQKIAKLFDALEERRSLCRGQSECGAFEYLQEHRIRALCGEAHIFSHRSGARVPEQSAVEYESNSCSPTLLKEKSVCRHYRLAPRRGVRNLGMVCSGDVDISFTLCEQMKQWQNVELQGNEAEGECLLLIILEQDP